MSRLGRWCALGAAALCVVTLATWDIGTTSSVTVEGATTASASVDGPQLFLQKGCSRCHLGPDTEPFGQGFPPLDDAASWAGSRRKGMTAEEYLSESMRVPSAFISPAFNGSIGGTRQMPTLMLSPEEIDAIVEYLLAKEAP